MHILTRHEVMVGRSGFAGRKAVRGCEKVDWGGTFHLVWVGTGRGRGHVRMDEFYLILRN